LENTAKNSQNCSAAPADCLIPGKLGNSEKSEPRTRQGRSKNNNDSPWAAELKMVSLEEKVQENRSESAIRNSRRWKMMWT